MPRRWRASSSGSAACPATSRTDLGETTDAATALRRERPRLALVDRTPTPPGAVTTLPAAVRTLPAGAVTTLPAGAVTTLPAGAVTTLPSWAMAAPGRSTGPVADRLAHAAVARAALCGGRPAGAAAVARAPVSAIAAAAGAALLIAIILAIASGGSARVVPAPPAAQVVPRVTSLAPPHATVGILEVSGPAGARPSIGAVVYPPAPCTVELPPGDYDVRLRSRRHVVTRHVSITAGHTTSL